MRVLVRLIWMEKSFLRLSEQSAHQMEFVVNVNYHGRLRKPLDLSRLTLPHSKLHSKPQQLVVKDKKGTVIFFNTGKFRVMGCIDAIEASFLAFKYTLKIDNDDFPELYSQSYTSRAKLG